MSLVQYSTRKHFRKLRLIIYNIIFSIVGKKYSKKAKLSVEESKEILEHFSERPKGKSKRKNDMIIPFMYDLQIIVPAYNVEKYLKQCIDSILCQKTKYSYLVCLIDDGSIDGTARIADDYLNNNQVKVVHQRNKGFSGARNTALENIYAKYIMFVDSDDMITSGAIETLLDVAYANNAEIVQGEFYEMNCEVSIEIRQPKGDAKYVYPALGNLKGFPCGKVFISNLFSEIVFPDGFWFEDSVLSFLMYPKVKRAFTIPQIVYIYRRTNISSISNTAREKPKCVDSFYITDLLIDEHHEMGLAVDQAYIEKVFRQIVLNARRVKNMSEVVKEAIFVQTCDMIEKKLPSELSSHAYNGLIKTIKERDYGAYCYYISLLGRKKWDLQ